MDLHDVTSIGRPLDFRLKSNIIVAIITFLTLILGTFIKMPEGVLLWDAFLWAVGASFAIFMTWALARELDPEKEYAAFPGVVIMAFAIMFSFYSEPAYLTILLILLIQRILNRTVGPAPKLMDSILIFLLAGYLAIFSLWVVGLVATLSFWLDSRLPNNVKHHRVFAILSLVVTIVSMWISSSTANLEWITLAYVVVALAAFIPILISRDKPKATTDYTNEPLDDIRVLTAQLISAFTLVAITLWKGRSGLLEVMPLWAAFLGIGFYRVFFLFKEKLQGSKNSE